MPLSLNHNKSESKRKRNYLMANMNPNSGDLLRTMQLVILIFISTVSTLLISPLIQNRQTGEAKARKKMRKTNGVCMSSRKT